MKGMRRTIRLLIISGQLLLIYWRLRGRFQQVWPYLRTVLSIRPDAMRVWGEINQIRDNIRSDSAAR